MNFHLFRRFVRQLLFAGLLALAFVKSSDAQNKLPSVDYAPKSPTAAAFSRYGEIPVSHSTGVPNIEIPLHTISMKGLEIPLTISYHASGIRVRDVASEVGLGFVLNTGGVITTTVIGLPDVNNDWVPDYKSAADIQTAINASRALGSSTIPGSLTERYWTILTGGESGYQADHFSDRFNYSLSTGESGVFRKDFITNAVKLMPYRPIKVTFNNPGQNDPPSTQIDMVSASGYKHYFKIRDVDYFALDKIVSPDKTDSIQYYYRSSFTTATNVSYNASWQSEEVYLEYDPGICGSLVGAAVPCLKRRLISPYALSNATGGLDIVLPYCRIASFPGMK